MLKRVRLFLRHLFGHWTEQERASYAISFAFRHTLRTNKGEAKLRSAMKHAKAGAYTFARLDALDSLRESIGEAHPEFEHVLWCGI